MISNIVYYFKEYFRFEKKIIWTVILPVILSLVISFLSLTLTRELVSMILQKVEPLELVIRLALLIIGIGLLNAFHHYLMMQLQIQGGLFRLNEMTNFFESIATVDYQLLENKAYNELKEKVSQTMSSNDSLSDIFPQHISLFLTQLLKLIVFGYLLSVLNPLFIGLILGLVVFTILYRLYQQTYFNKTREGLSSTDNQLNYIERVTANFSLAKDIRLFNVKPWFMELFNQVMTSRNKLSRGRAWVNFFGQLISALCILILTVFGYYYLIDKTLHQLMTMGEVTFYIGALTLVATTATEFINSVFNLKEDSEQIKLVRQYKNYPSLFNHHSQVDLPNTIESIEFKNVTFKYPEAEAPLFENFNLKLSKEDRIALVGVNGAGKTSLIKLLSNLYKPDAGQILINGIDNQKFDVTQYYDLFSVVLQESFTLPWSIKHAIIQGKEFNQAKYQQVIQQAGLSEIIKNLPHQDDTTLVKEVDSQATTLSGGQLQKLKLAQALYKDGPILILDEPTSALDPLAESEIYQQYHQTSSHKLSLFITHRLATTQFCNRILYMEKGQILEDGSHQELMNLKGKYYEMFMKQAHYYQEKEENK